MPSHGEKLYFNQLEAERRAQRRRKQEMAAAELAQKRSIADAVGTQDLNLAARIKALGFDGDSARVFDLLPLVHVAWADGSIQRAERAAILVCLHNRGVEPGTDAFTQIETLLEKRPSQAYLDESIAALRDLVGGSAKGKDLVDLCLSVAASAGGFVGLGKVAGSERALIEDIAAQLGDVAKTSTVTEIAN